MPDMRYGQELAGSMIALVSVVVIACEQALLVGKRSEPRENVRARGQGKARSHVLARLVSLAQTGELTGSVGLGGTRGGTRGMRPGGSSPIPTSYPFMYPFRILFSGI